MVFFLFKQKKNSGKKEKKSVYEGFMSDPSILRRPNVAKGPEVAEPWL